MNQEKLSSRFQKTLGKAIDYNGRVVLPIFKHMLVDRESCVVVRRLQAAKLPEQGIRIKAEKGEFEINNQRLSDIVLWSNSSPEVTELSIVSRGKCELKIWNVWRADELMQAWIGNSGMMLSDTGGDSIRFECSDGVGEIDFSNLIFEIEICKT